MIHKTPKVIMIGHGRRRWMHDTHSNLLRVCQKGKFEETRTEERRQIQQLAYGILANRRNNLRYQVRVA
jgi:hypothetical protein